MQRYKTLPLTERNFIHVSYMPREWELVWSLILGVWFAIIISKDIINPQESFTANIGYLIITIVTLLGYFGIISVGFSRAFRSGSFKTYAAIFCITVLVCEIMVYIFIRPLVTDLEKVLSFKALLSILFSSLALVFMVYGGIFSVARFIGIALKKTKREKDNFKNGNIYRNISIALAVFCLGAILAYAKYIINNWENVFCVPQIITVARLLLDNGKNSTEIMFKIYMVVALLLLVLLRIFGTELMYWKNRIEIRLHA